ncbi:MAG: hypothetical protein REI12_03865 [Pedobacter sp.]|nr:hypothetical protein [Pedobacter sp.]
MFESYLASSEMVLFWESEGIDKVMMFSDFQATLDGYVGIPAYAGEEKRAAYVQLDDNLKVRRCVLFLIGFDGSGFPERSWNLPLRHMAEIAGRGPDMGGGPVNLVCHSQCPISWHAIKLWDPVMRPTLNTFAQIASSVESAAERYSLRPAGSATTPSASAASDADIPVLTDEAPVAAVQPLTAAKAALWEQEKQALLERMAAQQLHISTLETDKNETIARLGFLHQQQSDILEAQNSKLLGQSKALKDQFDSQREQIEALRHQLASAGKLEENLAEERRLHEEQLSAVMHAKLGEENQKFEQLLKQKEQEFSTREARLRAEYQLSVEKRLSEEASRFQLQTESLRAELNYREDTINTLTREMAEVKSGNAQREQGAADEFLRRLESLGMNFVVFHAGAGHVSVPVPELATYVSSPLSYAAAKCMVTPEQYQSWLAHYENPRCSAAIGDNKCCEARLIRTDSPTRFVAGQSDRCARHQAADTAIDNVLRFR